MHNLCEHMFQAAQSLVGRSGALSRELKRETTEVGEIALLSTNVDGRQCIPPVNLGSPHSRVTVRLACDIGRT